MASYLIELGKLDPSRIVFKNINSRDIVDPNTRKPKFTNTTCSVQYKTPDGSLSDLIMITPQCRTSGIKKNWPLTLNDNEKNDDNVNGFQLPINITSRDTSDNPTDEQQQYIDQLDILREEAYKYIKKSDNIKYLQEKCPGPATFLEKGIAGLKCPYSEPKEITKDGSTFMVPHQQYIKLIAYNNRGPWLFISRFKGPGNRDVTPLNYIDVKGDVVVAVKFEKIYFGSHQNKPVGASMQFKVYECNFTPSRAEEIIPLLPPNESPLETDKDDNNAAPNDDDFAVPTPDDKFDPSKELANLSCETKSDEEEEEKPKKPTRKVQVRRRKVVKNAK